MVRGGTSGTVVDTHEVIRATRPVNLRALDGSAPAEPPASVTSVPGDDADAPLDGGAGDDSVSPSAADGRRP